MCRLPEKGRKDTDSRGDERQEQGRKTEMKESEGTEEITFPLYPFLLLGQQALPNCKPISVERPSDKSYRTPLPQQTIPPENVTITEAQPIHGTKRRREEEQTMTKQMQNVKPQTQK